MHDRLKELYEHVSVSATADREHEAAIELLLLVMMADRRVEPEELDEIREIAEQQGFESATFSFDQHYGEAMARVREAMATPGGVDLLLDDIDARISNGVLRSSLFAAARDVAEIDDQRDAAEDSVLARIAVRFS